MSLQWDESLLLGFEEIDNQHKAIFEQFGRLSEAAQEGTSNESIADLITFLFDYTLKHFANEEQIMTDYRYPKLDLQRQEHGDFARDTEELQKRVEADGASRELAIELTGKLIKWIILHIKKHDREMVEFIKESIALRQKYE